jgi:archaellin
VDALPGTLDDVKNAPNLQDLIASIQKRYIGNPKAKVIYYSSDLHVRPLGSEGPVSSEFKKVVVDTIYAGDGSCHVGRVDELTCPIESVTQAPGSSLIELNQSRTKLIYGDKSRIDLTYLDHEAVGTVKIISANELEVTTEFKVLFNKKTGKLTKTEGSDVEIYNVALTLRVLWTTKKNNKTTIGASSQKLLTEVGMSYLLPTTCENKDGDK